MSKTLTTVRKTKGAKVKQQSGKDEQYPPEDTVIAEYLRDKIPRKRFVGMVGKETYQAIGDRLAASIHEMTRKVKYQQTKVPTDDEATSLAVMGRENSFILWNFPLHYGAGPMNRVRVVDRTIWVFPIVLTSPGYGIVDEVGHIAVDTEKDQIIGCTPVDRATQRGRECEEQKKEELAAAFLRARRA